MSLNVPGDNGEEGLASCSEGLAEQPSCDSGAV